MSRFDREEWLSEQVKLLALRLSNTNLSFLERSITIGELERHLSELEQMIAAKRYRPQSAA